MTEQLIARPSMGFVVEGDAEFHSYPSLVAGMTGAPGGYFPCSNARGYGNILKNVGGFLDRLVRAHHPYHVIVTIDLREPIRDKCCTSCSELREGIERSILTWRQAAEGKDDLRPLPQTVIVVIQVQSLETWIIADVRSLEEMGYIRKGVRQPSNVDETIPNPREWLHRYLKKGVDPKHPPTCKALVSCLRPAVMNENSRSFGKFNREVMRFYSRWCEECGLLGEA